LEIETELLKLLSTKHFTKTPRPKVGLKKLAEALNRLGVTGVSAEALVEPLLALKGRGYAQTEPKIILKEEFPTAEFEVWPTPLGLSELARRLEAAGGAAPAPAQKPPSAPAKPPAAAAKPAPAPAKPKPGPNPPPKK
jgi:hypothetical protein